MSSSSYFSTMISNIYAHLWYKYRPVVLQRMIASSTGPQQYKLSSHEVKGINPKEKGGYAFTLQAFQGKAVNNIKSSVVAQGLLGVLQQSRKATELMDKDTYEFILDKQFVLHINKKEEKVETVQDSVN